MTVVPPKVSFFSTPVILLYKVGAKQKQELLVVTCYITPVLLIGFWPCEIIISSCAVWYQTIDVLPLTVCVCVCTRFSGVSLVAQDNIGGHVLLHNTWQSKLQ